MIARAVRIAVIAAGFVSLGIVTFAGKQWHDGMIDSFALASHDIGVDAAVKIVNERKFYVGKGDCRVFFTLNNLQMMADLGMFQWIVECEKGPML
jgi:hypothetical protein